MNAHLRDVPDGEIAQRVLIMGSNGKPCPPVYEHRVYWPFSLVEDFYDLTKGRYLWSVTHLPSGYRAAGPVTKRTALTIIRRFRALSVDMTFTRPKGQKWNAAKGPIKAIVAKFKRVK